jgi:hypothetical protein
MVARQHPDEIDRFADTARRYCKWCESDKSRVAPGKLGFDALRALADVYRAGFLLPDTDKIDILHAERLSKEQRKAIARKLDKLPFQYYWRLSQPSDFEGHKEPVCGDLLDDFLDIYADIIEGLWLYEKNQVQAAVYLWRLRFGEHWGLRAVNALTALHTHALEASG